MCGYDEENEVTPFPQRAEDAGLSWLGHATDSAMCTSAITDWDMDGGALGASEPSLLPY
jgi:hypothetical protein